MSSFLVNFSKFFDARQERDARAAAQAEQARQFFAQLEQQKAMAEAARAEQVRQFDLSRQDTQQSRMDAEKVALFNAQAQGLARPAGDMQDPLTQNPFQMKVVTDAASLASPTTPTTTLPEAGSFQFAGQQVMPTTPVERGMSMLPVKQKEAETEIELEKQKQKAKLMAGLEFFDANAPKDLDPTIRTYWRSQLAAGKPVDPISNIGELATLKFMQGDYDGAQKLMDMQARLYSGMSRMPSFNPENPSTQATAARNLATQIRGIIGNKINYSEPDRQKVGLQINGAIREFMASPQGQALATQDPQLFQQALGELEQMLLSTVPPATQEKPDLLGQAIKGAMSSKPVLGSR